MSNNNEDISKSNLEAKLNTSVDNEKKKIMVKVVFLVLGGLLLGYLAGMVLGYTIHLSFSY